MSLSRKKRAAFVVALVAAGLSVPVGAPTAQDANALGRDLDAILAAPSLTGSDVGLVVRKADTGEVLYTRQSAQRRQPASNAKLLTAASALDTLGADKRFRTTVETSGQPVGTALKGDLYLRGGGDPTMLASDYDALATQVAAAGITEVKGKLVADDTYFDKVRLGLGWAWDDEPYSYNAQTSALTIAPDSDFDAGAIVVRVKPGTEGGKAAVDLVPPNNYVKVVNTATTTAAGGATAITVDREHGSNTFTVSGSLPVGSAGKSSYMAVWEPSGLAASVFSDALARHGVLVKGSTTFAATPVGTTVVAQRDSIPVGELLKPFLKLSNNMHGETLVKAAGKQVTGRGTWDDGIATLEKDFSSLGVNSAALSLVDGSGLSRMDEVSPDQISAALIAAQGKPWFTQFYDALPVAGIADRLVGGTLRSRMVGTAAQGNVHAKTGSFTGASALSGYVTAADGQRLVFSMVTNQALGSPRSIEDAIAVRLAQYNGAADVSMASPKISSLTVDDQADQRECSWLKAC
jgi:D-alanyl-D-alanine carboxypeptidase/D-alanyl-D-alanine-endopeptidase (penicillin-binding protein 4)